MEDQQPAGFEQELDTLRGLGINDAELERHRAKVTSLIYAAERSLRPAPHPGPRERLTAELAANAAKPDPWPVTDSSLTYGDLRHMASLLDASAHKLADMLCEREPHRLPDDGDTEMTITVADARRIAWALLSPKVV